MDSNQVRCPRCKSTSVTANKKGFSGGKAIVGGILTGGIGLLAGTIGSGNVTITCLQCGHKFKPGQGAKTTDFQKPTESIYGAPVIPNEEQKYSGNKTANIGCVVLIIVGLITIVFVTFQTCRSFELSKSETVIASPPPGITKIVDLISSIKKDSLYNIKQVNYDPAEYSLTISFKDKENMVADHAYSAYYFVKNYSLENFTNIKTIRLYQWRKKSNLFLDSYKW